MSKAYLFIISSFVTLWHSSQCMSSSNPTNNYISSSINAIAFQNQNTPSSCHSISDKDKNNNIYISHITSKSDNDLYDFELAKTFLGYAYTPNLKLNASEYSKRRLSDEDYKYVDVNKLFF